MVRDPRVFVFDHVSLGVEDLDRAGAFYDACLAPLGYVRLWRAPRAVGYGPEGYEAEAPFAIVLGGAEARAPGRGFHAAFVAPTRAAVDGFHAAALSQGGLDEGPPGIRENYNPRYYAAFVRDPDGHRLEAVLHEPELASAPPPEVTAIQSVLVGPDDPDIVALEAELRGAQLAADVGTLERLIAADLLFTGPDGQLGTKAQDLAAHRSGAVRIREHVPSELRIRRVGADVAVVALRTRLAVEVGGVQVEGTYRYTRVWAREQGSWRVVGGHVAAAPA